MFIEDYHYTINPPPLKNIGILYEDITDDEPLLIECLYGFDTYLKKYAMHNEDYRYDIVFRIGYVSLFYFYKKEKSLRELFLNCKDYTILRTDLKTGEQMHCGLLKDDKLKIANEYGPLDDTYFNDSYTDYAKQMAKKMVK